MEPEKETSLLARSSLLLPGLLGSLAFGFILVHKMSQKWKKPGHAEKGASDDPQPAAYCHYNPASIQTVAIKETTEDKQWKAVQKTVWRLQLRRATCLNIISAIGVLFTGIAAGGAIWYGIVAYRQWQDAHNNFVTDERAWLGTPQAGITKLQLPILESFVNITNTGKTPALQVNWAAKEGFDRMPQTQDEWKKFWDSLKAKKNFIFESGYSGTIAPQGATRLQFTMDVSSLCNSTCQTQVISDLAAKKSFFHFRGQITYRDALTKQTRSTSFCYYWPNPYTPNSADTVMAPCPIGNDMQ